MTSDILIEDTQVVIEGDLIAKGTQAVVEGNLWVKGAQVVIEGGLWIHGGDGNVSHFIVNKDEVQCLKITTFHIQTTGLIIKVGETLTDLPAEIGKLINEVATLRKALKDAKIPIPTTGTGGNWDG